MTVRLVGCSDREHQTPLSKQRAIGREERVPSVVNARRLRRGAVKLDNLKIAGFFKVLVIPVTNVVSADKEIWQLVRNLVDRPPQSFRVKMHSIAKNAALCMVTCFDEF